jgi:hypothetical protein
MRRRFTAIPISFLLLSGTIKAHPGRTDSSGGHYNRKTGDYHYHGGGSGSSISISSLSRTVARLTPRFEARTTAPKLRTKAARTYSAEDESAEWDKMRQQAEEIRAAERERKRELDEREATLSAREAELTEAQRQLQAQAEANDLLRQQLVAAKAAEDEKYRTWTSATGKDTIEAKLISVAQSIVTLEKRDRKRIKVPIDKLRESDRKFIDQWRRERRWR